MFYTKLVSLFTKSITVKFVNQLSSPILLPKNNCSSIVESVVFQMYADWQYAPHEAISLSSSQTAKVELL